MSLEKITTPKKVSWNIEKNCALLNFGDYKNNFLVVGGIAFPEAHGAYGGAILEGFACLVGCDLDSRCAYVFEEFPYVFSIGRDKLSLDWFLDFCFHSYFNRYWYYCDDQKKFRKYIVPIEKLGKRTHYHYVPVIMDFDNDKISLLELLTLQRLFFRKNGRIHTSLEYYQSSLIKESTELKALLVALTGLEKKLEKLKINLFAC